jgi:hypothetical protein
LNKLLEVCGGEARGHAEKVIDEGAMKRYVNKSEKKNISGGWLVAVK